MDIVDNAPYAVSYAPDRVELVEGTSQEVTITLDRAFHDPQGTPLNVTVQFDASLFTPSSGQAGFEDISLTSAAGDISVPVSFAEGARSTTVTLHALADDAAEGAETARLEVTGAGSRIDDNGLDITIDDPSRPAAPAFSGTQGPLTEATFVMQAIAAMMSGN